MSTAFERHGHHDLDAREKPPEALRALFKKYQKMTAEALAADTDVVNCDHERPNQPPTFKQIGSLGATRLRAIFDEFEDEEVCRDSMARSYTDKNIIHDTALLESVTIPGKRAEDCAGNGADRDPDLMFQPKDSSTHKPISIRNALEKKLRWITLGEQYDWTAKTYPDTEPPKFPGDIQELLRSLFSNIESQAAIVNLYSPGDVLSMHRDVSEHCDRGLISISIGCDALFVIGHSHGTAVTMRLRSGDAICMTGPARWAWHGVPKVMSQTCPKDLESWPVLDQESEALDCWRGWMSRKRININVRQVTDMHRTPG